MSNFITRWYMQVKLNRVTDVLLGSPDSTDFLKHFVDWSKLIVVNIDESIFYQQRLKTEYVNAEKLLRCFHLLEGNINRNLSKELSGSLQTLTMHDWLVDKDSYRLSLQTLLEKLEPIIGLILSGLEGIHNTEVTYYMMSAAPIFVTLRSIVEICSRQ